MINTGGTAFPTTEDNYKDQRWSSSGLTIRDYFAGEAMQAMIIKGMEDTKRGAKGVPFIVQYAYEYADAMIKQRNKKGV